MIPSPTIVIPLAIVLGVFVLGIRILQEFERGVVFRLGRFNGVKPAGLPVDHPGRRPHGEGRACERS